MPLNHTLPNAHQAEPNQPLSHTLSAQSGSYLASDVILLLDIIAKDSVADVPVDQKEALIQSGQQHYSDMLTLERAPSKTHEQLFQQALIQGTERMAADIASLAHTLQTIFSDKVSPASPLILVSLVRAGLPIGVLLQRALSDSQAPNQLPSRHYGISIIRDRGLDPVALQTILLTYPDSPIIFVDGWTGKGAIYGELERSLAPFNHVEHPNYKNIYHQSHQDIATIPLLTLADPADVAWLSASHTDWLIPSGLLGSTVSGLISRTLYTEPSTNLSSGLHRSVLYDNLADFDHSLMFVDTIDSARRRLVSAGHSGLLLPLHPTARYSTQPIISKLAAQYHIDNPNRIKPTIAEATRALLRRDPDRVLLASAQHPDTVLLRHLCDQKRLKIDIAGDDILPYQAVTIIKDRSD
ncbi:MAG: tellurite-like stress resistance cysteine protease StiP [Psychrobacter sp.]|nr:tellurite-like stress resistance cysteine protease StiP [Psychrobacter sp.]